MASTYSTDLKLELMVTGENAGTWGDKTNTNLNLIQQAIAGYQGVSIAGGAQTTALAMSNATISNARNMVIEFTGAITGNQIVTIPNGIEKYYILKNSTTGAFTVTFKYASVGTGITLTQGYLTAAYGDGSEIYKVDLTTLQGTIATAQIANLAVTSGKLASFAVTTARINSLAVTSTRLATFGVTTAKLNSLAVTSTRLASFAVTSGKIATGAVTATRLANTAVTPGSYTAASITVDAQGRITSASSGAAATRTGYEVKQITQGPASGNYTANANALRIAAYIAAGSGGGNGNDANGGRGGAGVWYKTITQPFSQPYSIGATGNANPGSGQPGGATNFTNVGTANAGGGGNLGVEGTAGNAPGASFDLTNASQVRVAYFGNSGINNGVWQGGPGTLQIWENVNT